MTNRRLTDALAALRGRLLADIRGACVARVESYDATRQVASVRPVQPQTIRDLDDDGEEQVRYAQQPAVDEVPVVFMGTPAAGLSFPVPVGTEGVFIPYERDHGDYQTTGEPPAEQRILDRHTLGCGGVFLPTVVAFAANVPAAEGATVLSGDDVRLGSAAATQKMARADRVDAELARIAERLYFIESYLNQAASWVELLQAAILALAPAFPGIPPLWSPTSPLGGALVGAWTGWAGLRPWLVDPGTPAGYPGTGATGADKVKGV